MPYRRHLVAVACPKASCSQPHRVRKPLCCQCGCGSRSTAQHHKIRDRARSSVPGWVLRRVRRHRIGELLLASEGPYAGAAYCVTLATFGASADADLLCRYLDHYLLRPDLDYDQGFALDALLHLDAALGSERASRYLAAGGLWQQWTDAPPPRNQDPQKYRQVVHQLCSFASECAELFAALENER
ncbi:DUF6000 family protein [Streptomyces sp. NPDC013171]|uniref:DUF6000 family protein n=1 Tax=Streptomyces sp. NPDC013171 TaxID=3364863 RepID=UPI0036CAD106